MVPTASCGRARSQRLLPGVADRSRARRPALYERQLFDRTLCGRETAKLCDRQAS